MIRPALLPFVGAGSKPARFSGGRSFPCAVPPSQGTGRLSGGLFFEGQRIAPHPPQESPKGGQFKSPPLTKGGAAAPPVGTLPGEKTERPGRYEVRPGRYLIFVRKLGVIPQEGARRPPLWPEGDFQRGHSGMPPLASFLGGLGAPSFPRGKDGPPGGCPGGGAWKRWPQKGRAGLEPAPTEGVGENRRGAQYAPARAGESGAPQISPPVSLR